jgi:pSer/pThr/pTyr-binding forkhead associated (FHA) protein
MVTARPDVAPMDLSTALKRISSDSSSVIIGRDSPICAGNFMVSAEHVIISRDESTGDYYVSDMDSTNGTWLNRARLRRGGKSRIVPGDDIYLGPRGDGQCRLRVKLRKRNSAAQASNEGMSSSEQVPVAR